MVNSDSRMVYDFPAPYAITSGITILHTELPDYAGDNGTSFEVLDQGGASRLRVNTDAGRYQVIASDGSIYTGPTLIDVNEPYTIAVSINASADSLDLYVNGLKATGVSCPASTTALSRIAFGNQATDGTTDNLQANTCMQVVYARKLSDEEVGMASSICRTVVEESDW